MKIKICRKEAKESRYWLKLINCNNKESEKEQGNLIQEADELMKISGAILERSINPRRF